MKNFESFKLFKNILNSRDKKRFNSANSYIRYNTYKCQEHNDFFNKVCLKCNMDICPKCEKNFHSTHQTIKYDDIIPDNLEIKNLQNQIKTYLDIFDYLRKEINTWYNEIKEKMKCFEHIYNNNEIINSYDLIMNYSSKNIICLDTIYRFRKIYYNIIEHEINDNNKNKNILMKINNLGNDILPTYLNFQKIQNLLQNLKQIKKENSKIKNELIFDYLNSIPSDIISSNSVKFDSIKHHKKSESSVSPLEKINSNSLCDKSTGYDNYKTISNEVKEKEFKQILNKTIITDFKIENPFLNNKTILNTENNLNNTFSLGQKQFNVSNFNKYLNKMGFVDSKIDLHKVNSSQNLLNKYSTSIKSTKYTNSPNLQKSDSTQGFIYKKQKYIPQLSKSSMNSPKTDYKYKNNCYQNNNVQKEIQIKKIKYDKNWFNHPLLTNRKTQKKTYVHKKFKNDKQNNEIFLPK